MATANETNTVAVNAIDTGLSECPVCVVVWLYMKKYGNVIIAILITGSLVLFISSIFFCYYRRKMKRTIRRITREKGTAINGQMDKSVRRKEASEPAEYNTYEELKTFAQPLSVESLSYLAEDPAKMEGLIIPQQDTHRIAPLPSRPHDALPGAPGACVAGNVDYLHPSPEACGGHKMNTYIGEVGRPRAHLPDYLTPSLDDQPVWPTEPDKKHSS